MCGIIGVLGKSDVSPIIIETLRRLEYRGYDSAGIATLDAGALTCRRAVGKLSELEAVLGTQPVSGTSGIGHTRWATHGAATTQNAHPHIAGPVAVVHNGIIENFRELREELTAKGMNFASETDTEVVAQLCAHYIAQGKTPQDAVAATLSRLTGAFALAFLFEGEDDLMIAARRGSPLAIGHGDGEMFIGSDAMALAPVTNRITYLEEGDWAVLTRAGAQVFDALGNPADRTIRVVNVDQIMVDKGEHRHFMLKEIHEQPSVTAFALSHYLNPERTAINLPESDIDFSQFDRLVLVACGTAHYACAVAKYWFEQIARIPVEIDVASEFRYREPPMNGRECVMFISQSGETADTLAALRYVQGKAASIVAIVNVAESSISREADFSLPIMAGPEISVASTKAFTCQLTVLACLAILAGRQHGTIDETEETRLIEELMSAPRLIGEAIKTSADLNLASRDLAKAQDILFLGRGPLFPLALEGALKLKELSYIHAEGFPSGELKHGPIALVDDTVPVIVFAPSGGLFEKTVSNMEEVMARGGKILLITDEEGAATASHGVWRTVILPKVDPLIAPIVYAVPAQLLAYHTAVEKGTDVDQPRNLAKSVTVE
ncbi:MAG: glutamine--fructose-6-phosphate transaminase (isomerizing) [Rhodobacteraceae bacterium]|nr:MAG: glutamine--fructose-6-phosphate transaminase (isomerizing) [Paracoccaceae bacterium]